jgi:hypothetical protein
MDTVILCFDFSNMKLFVHSTRQYLFPSRHSISARVAFSKYLGPRPHSSDTHALSRQRSPSSPSVQQKAHLSRPSRRGRPRAATDGWQQASSVPRKRNRRPKKIRTSLFFREQERRTRNFFPHREGTNAARSWRGLRGNGDGGRGGDAARRCGGYSGGPAGGGRGDPAADIDASALVRARPPPPPSQVLLPPRGQRLPPHRCVRLHTSARRT